MKKYLLAAVAVIAIAVPVAMPAIASAMSTKGVTALVQVAWAKELRQILRFHGTAVASTALQCASGGGGYYTCEGTYIAVKGRLRAKWSQTIQVSGQNYEAAPASFIRAW